MNDNHNTLAMYNESQIETVGKKTELAKKEETISSVLAAQAKAEVEARLIVAMKNPRNHAVVRDKMKKECERPGFADIAWYDLERQYKGSGFSVRFAEAAMRNMGNLDPRSTIVYDDDEKIILKVEVVDLETNINISNMILIRKEVERSFLKAGEVAISQRSNSNGKTTFLRRATSAEMMPLINSQVSKAYRTAILRLLPGDIQDDCKRRILQVRAKGDATDPDAVKRQVCDGFSSIGIGPDLLVKYLGHNIDSATPPELEELRLLFKNVRSGEVSFHEELELREIDREEKRNKKSKLEEIEEKVKTNAKS